jgi:hypothetical protein
MAFGTPRSGSPLTNQSTSPGTGISASGSIAVSVGDLIVVFQACRSTPAGSTPSATFTGGGAASAFSASYNYDAGNAAFEAFYARVTTAGTLTQIAMTHSSTTNDVALVVAVFEGPFASSPLDANPGGATDTTSPFTCPGSGTLSQADELVLGFFAATNGLGTGSVAAVSPATMCGEASSGTGTNTVSGHMNYNVVSSTSTAFNEFTNASDPSSSGALGTATFKKDTSAAAASLVFNPFAAFATMLVR